MKPILFFILWIATSTTAQTLYLDPTNGDDAAPGTAQTPLKTLAKAAEILNNYKTEGPATLILTPGLYALDSTVVFSANASERLTLQAAILPDDSAWTPQSMPVLLSTQTPDKWSPSGQPPWTAGLQFERSHVTVRGLKFLGSPVPNSWYYPIARYGTSLTDLEVTQCAFVMDRAGVTANVGVLANGHGTVIDHCVFYRCRNPVVFWRAEGGKSTGNAMHHCVIHDAYTSAIWVCDTEMDLTFHHNVIDGAEYVWMRDEGGARDYSLSDCLITNFTHYSGQSGENFSLSLTGPEIVYHETRVVKTGRVELVQDQGIDVPLPKNYLHVKPGTPGSELGAGLFLKKEGDR